MKKKVKVGKRTLEYDLEGKDNPQSIRKTLNEHLKERHQRKRGGLPKK